VCVFDLFLFSQMVNVHSIADELLIMILFIKFVGLDTVSYSLKHFYSVWVEPQAGPYVKLALDKVKIKTASPFRLPIYSPNHVRIKTRQQP